jgi:hypothetical protein
MSTDTDEIKIPFWGSNPNIILQSDYVTELFPVESMTYEQKLNAITRGIILISIISFALTQNFRIIVVSILTVLSIYLLYLHQERENDKKKKVVEEKFVNPADDVLKSKSILRDASVFDTPDSSNPFGNTLVTDYQYNPNKKPAPPAFNESVNEKILAQAKTLVKELNPDQPDISDKLFKDLGEQYVFEQSLRQFTSNPSTTVMNDQTGFADFCYGSMTSCKEGNLFACARNLPRHLNY